MSDVTLSGLYIYPVKSLAGILVQASVVDGFGLAFDRRWMLVDIEGAFLSQRQLPRMALIQQSILDDELILQAKGYGTLTLPLHPVEGKQLRVQVWRDSCEAWHCGTEVDAWLTGFLGHACHLVYMPDDIYRQVDQDFAEPKDKTAFSDGFPMLLIAEASLEDLNRRLSVPMTMQRFRPNLIVAGCDPYAEDDWSRIMIDKLSFRVVKLCTRCVITTINPETAERGAEPLQTLFNYRRRGNKVFFGQNLVHDTEGYLSVGMRLQVVERSGG